MFGEIRHILRIILNLLACPVYWLVEAGVLVLGGAIVSAETSVAVHSGGGTCLKSHLATARSLFNEFNSDLVEWRFEHLCRIVSNSPRTPLDPVFIVRSFEHTVVKKNNGTQKKCFFCFFLTSEISRLCLNK